MTSYPVMPVASDGAVAVAARPASLSLGDLLAPSDIEIDVPAASKREGLVHLAQLLAGPAGASKRDVAAALVRRERLGPTYVGDGIAIPHGRVPGSIAPAAAAIRLRHPVDYGTTEHDTAHLLVGVTWPDEQPAGFVSSLASIWRLLRKTGQAKAVREGTDREEIHRVLTGEGGPGRQEQGAPAQT